MTNLENNDMEDIDVMNPTEWLDKTQVIEAWSVVDKMYAAQKERIDNGKNGQSILGDAKNNKDFWDKVAQIDWWPWLDDIMKYIKSTQKWSINHDTIRNAVQDGSFTAKPGNGKDFSLTKVYLELIDISKPKLENKLESSQWFAGLNIDLQNTSYTWLTALDFVKDQSEWQGVERKKAVYNYIKTPLGDDTLVDDKYFKDALNGTNGELRLDFYSIPNFEKSVPNINLIFHLCKQKGEKIESFKDRFQKSIEDNKEYINAPIKLFDLPNQSVSRLKEQYPWADINTVNWVTTIVYSLRSIRSYLKVEKDQYYRNSFSTETWTGTWSNSNNIGNINLGERGYMTKEYLWGKIFNKEQNLLLQPEMWELWNLDKENKNTLSAWNSALAKINQFKLVPFNTIPVSKNPDWSWMMTQGNVKKPINDVGSIMDINDGYKNWFFYALTPDPKAKNSNEYILYSYRNAAYDDTKFREINFRGQRPTTKTFDSDQQKT